LAIYNHHQAEYRTLSGGGAPTIIQCNKNITYNYEFAFFWCI